MMKTIEHQLKPLVSVQRLARLLSMSVGELRRLAEDAESLYKPFVQTKIKNGRVKHRPIDNPQNPLKDVQRRIKTRILDQVALPAWACGGVRGRSTKMNAAFHVDKTEVAAVDIRTFFNTLTNARVAAMLKRTFGSGDETTWLLTRLLTFEGHLPQGSPASTAAATLVLLPALERINVGCAQRGLAFSVYVDE